MNQTVTKVAKAALYLEFVCILIYFAFVFPMVVELFGRIHLLVKILFAIIWIGLSFLPRDKGNGCFFLLLLIGYSLPIVINEIIYATNTTNTLLKHQTEMTILAAFFIVLAILKFNDDRSALKKKKYTTVSEPSKPDFNKLRY